MQLAEKKEKLVQLSSEAQEGSVELRIGELAKKTGKTTRALRLYEELGLLVPSGRTDGGFRLYHEANAERVFWIGKLQDLGFTLPQIQSLLNTSQSPGVPKEVVKNLRIEFQSRLEQLDSQMTRLSQLREELADSLDYLSGCISCDHIQEAAKAKDICSSCGRSDSFPPLLSNLWQPTES